MKKLIGIGILLALAFPALACDEACQRERASAATNTEFPGYLSWKFCDDTKASFLEGDIRSLETYRHQRMNIEHKRRMLNIQTFVEQRKEWLKECDTYLEATNHGRIFQDKETTDKVFNAMDQVSQELEAVIKGTTYVADSTDTSKDSIIAAKFDTLFKAIDDHKTVMMIKGQFVTK